MAPPVLRTLKDMAGQRAIHRRDFSIWTFSEITGGRVFVKCSDPEGMSNSQWLPETKHVSSDLIIIPKENKENVT